MATKGSQFDGPGRKWFGVRSLLALALGIMIVSAATVVWAGGARRAFDGRGDDDREALQVTPAVSASGAGTFIQ